MSSKTPKNTTTTALPFYGSEETFGAPHKMWRSMNIDPMTGLPFKYQGPNERGTAFDPLEASAYNETARLNAAPNPYSGMAMGQANRLFNQENPAATNRILQTLDSQYLSEENPGMQSVLDTIGKNVTKQYEAATGETGSGFSGRGTLGGSRHREAQNANQDILAKSLAEQQGNLIYDNYNQRLAEQNAMAGQVASRGDAYNLAGADEMRFANANRNLRLGGYHRSSVTDPNNMTWFGNEQRAYDWRMGAPTREADLLSNLNRGSGQGNVVSAPGPSGVQQAGQIINTGANAYSSFFPSK